MIRSSVDLPQPEGPDQGNELAGLDVEVDALQRRHSGLELLRDALDRNGVHAKFSGARFRTSRSRTTIARKKTMPSSAQTMIVAHRFAGWIV